jgi:hypothetical protein
MTIPASVEQEIQERATAAVKAFRKELGLELPGYPRDFGHSTLLSAFERVLLPSMKPHFEEYARAEFQRIGREYVRNIVLKVFDQFIEKGL